MADRPFMGMTFPIIEETANRNGHMPYFIWHMKYGIWRWLNQEIPITG
jgi:hypothetical protein